MLDQEIRGKIAEYLKGEISLQDFNKWFGPVTWDVHLTENYEAVKLTGKVGLWLAEYSLDHLSEEEMRLEMGRLLSQPTNVLTGTSSVTVYRKEPFGSAILRLQSAATSNVAEYA